jgi:hypothetical protein
MSLAARKYIELNYKLGSLGAEFKFWRDLSELNQPFRKHHTQIRRVTASLEGMIAQVTSDLAAAQATPATALARCRELEIDILAAHRIWDYFRRKLALRGIDRFEKFLFAADEFAWACYEPAQLKATGIAPAAVREPPLVYFHGASSPIASSRSASFQAEDGDQNERPSRGQLFELLKRLPIPVVGVPWFQIEHLPDAVLLGHEVGHNVYFDFGLAPRVQELLGEVGVPAERLPAWRMWASEIFADFYGTLAAGPAFVGALIDFLVSDPDIVTNDQRHAGAWGDYPPDYLRVLLNLQFLEQREPAFKSEALADEWTAVYKSHAMVAFVNDLTPIAKTLLTGKFPQFGGVTLPEVFSFSQAQHLLATTEAENVLNRLGVAADDVRILLSAARIAFARDPSGYERLKVPALILAKVPRTTTLRAAKMLDEDATLASRLALDRSAGATLLKELRMKRSGNAASA